MSVAEPPPPEFSRPVKLDTLGPERRFDIAADGDERAALARRFGLAALDRLDAALDVAREGDRVSVKGRLRAALAQPCVVTGEPVAAILDEPVELMFQPPAAFGTANEEEIELDAADLDMLPHDGLLVDLGEAAAQTLGLALDPYPRSPAAAAVLKSAGVIDEAAAGPFAALAALRDSPGKGG